MLESWLATGIYFDPLFIIELLDGTSTDTAAGHGEVDATENTVRAISVMEMNACII